MRTLPFLVLFTLLAPALAGCLTFEAPTPAAVRPQEVPLLDGQVLERVSIPLPDGVNLDASVLRPDTDEPVPVLVDIGPYFGNLAGETPEFSGFDERLAEYFVPRGYAVARASLRGTGASEGCFTLGDEQERKDIYEIVEFLAGEPWANGNVAVIGKSYDGTTAWQAAVAAPPSLKTVVPISGITDMYRYMFYDGTAYFHGPIFNTYYGLIVDWDVDPFTPYVYQGHESQNAVRTCTDFPVQVAEGLETGVSGDHDAFWDARDYTPLLENIEASVFLVHGLQDWNVKPDHSIPVFNDLDVPKKAWLGQWAHDYPDLNRYNEEWSRSDWNETLLEWFDHFLKGVDNGALDGSAVEVQDPQGAWRNESAWPPGRVTDLTLYPAGDRLAVEPSEQGAEVRRFMADPVNEPSPSAAPLPTGLAFATDPLTAPLRVAGQPTFMAQVAVNQPAANLAVTLFDVDENGTWHEVDWGFLDLRHRNSRDAGEPVTPGEVMEVTVNLYPQDLVFEEGHRVGVVVSGEKPSWILPSKAAPAVYDLNLGPGAPTALTLPVLPEADGGLMERQPPGAEPVGNLAFGLQN